MLRSAIFVVAASACISVPALAQTDPGAPGTSIVRGSCSQLVVGGENLTKRCKNELANVILPDGTVMFIFSHSGRMVGFQGAGQGVKGGSNGAAVLPVQFVNVGTGDARPEVTRAQGSCRFSDPYVGRATIDCSARSQFGTITAKFRTDGRPPRVR